MFFPWPRNTPLPTPSSPASQVGGEGEEGPEARLDFYSLRALLLSLSVGGAGKVSTSDSANAHLASVSLVGTVGAVGAGQCAPTFSRTHPEIRILAVA